MGSDGRLRFALVFNANFPLQLTLSQKKGEVKNAFLGVPNRKY
jgi:hypothetical protein